MDFNSQGEHFLSLVQQHCLLWDKRNVNFKNKEMKYFVWSQIGEVFGLTGDQASTAFVSLRQKYLREKEKIKSSGGKQKTPWFLFDLLRFLDSVITPRKTHSSLSRKPSYQSNNYIRPSFVSIVENIEGEGNSNSNSNSNIQDNCSLTLSPDTSMSSEIKIEISDTFIHPPEQPPPESPTENSLPPSNVTACRAPMSPTPGPSNKKRKIDDLNFKALITAMEAPVKIQKEDTWRVKDDVKAFCKFLATKLNKLPDNVRSDLEMKILVDLKEIEETLRK